MKQLISNYNIPILNYRRYLNKDLIEENNIQLILSTNLYCRFEINKSGSMLGYFPYILIYQFPYIRGV